MENNNNNPLIRRTKAVLEERTDLNEQDINNVSQFIDRISIFSTFSPEVYLFGSSLQTSRYNDIDLLVLKANPNYFYFLNNESFQVRNIEKKEIHDEYGPFISQARYKLESSNGRTLIDLNYSICSLSEIKEETGMVPLELLSSKIIKEVYSRKALLSSLLSNWFGGEKK